MYASWYARIKKEGNVGYLNINDLLLGNFRLPRTRAAVAIPITASHTIKFGNSGTTQTLDSVILKTTDHVVRYSPV